MNRALTLLLLLIVTAGYGLTPAVVRLNSASLIELSSTYDSLVNPTLQRRINAYKQQMDATVGRRIGTVTKTMTASQPESPLSNFLSDQLLAWATKHTSSRVDVALINFGGIRASLNKGSLTVGDLYQALPFENKLVIVALKGKDLEALLKHLAKNGGEGIAGAQVEIKGTTLSRSLIAGQPIDASAIYRVATMDYLAQGNSGMTALLKAQYVEPTGVTVRDCIIEQIESLTAKGKSIDAKRDGRIKIVTEP